MIENKYHFITTKDVKERLGIGINQTRALIKRKDFPKIMIGRKILIPEEEFEMWLRRNLYKKIDI